MDFKDLEDGHPEEEAVYNVKIKKLSSGETRKAKAQWVRGTGFVLVDGQLGDEEYIFAWNNF
tara:strand:+ start:42 stop:227 length:186 start_codon:yes stop_codon:yes gene_type:complete